MFNTKRYPMRLFPDQRNNLARGDVGQLLEWWLNSVWFWFILSLFYFFKSVLTGVLCLAILLLVSIIIMVREIIGEHRYQIKMFGKSDWFNSKK
jgi:hypothetical protein